MTFTYLFAGLAHWTHFTYYLSLVPSFMPEPRLWVVGAGLAQVLISFFLPLQVTRKWACYTLIFFLAATLPLDAFVLAEKGAGIPLPFWVLQSRAPFHMALMLWAWWHSRTEVDKPEFSATMKSP